MYILGLDTGTTNWKANLYDYKGRLIASAGMPTQTKKDKNGRHYYDPEGLWKAVCSLTKQIVKKVKDPSQIKAVGFASMAEAGLLVDECGRPLTHIIPWYDNRSIKEKEILEKKLGKYEIFKTTGIFLTHIYSAPKILWLREHERASFKKASKWLCMPDYLIFRFSGEYATDYSIATRTAAFDIRQRKWAPKILGALGVKESFFPKAAVSGTIVGTVNKKASQESGLAVGTKLGLGGHDHVVGSYGIGMFGGGDLLDSIGTSESVVTLMEDYGRTKEIYNSGFSMGCYTYGNLYYIMSGIYSSGGLTEWFMKEFYGEKLSKQEQYARLNEDLSKAKVGSRGVFAVPYWMGRGAPYKNPIAKGALLGLTAHSTRADILCSIYEGLSLEFRQLVAAMEGATGVRVKNINVIGGGARNKFWMSRKSDVMGRKLTVPNVPESVCFGAALMAGVGAGEIKDPSRVTSSFKREYFTPNSSNHKYYDKFYRENYRKMGDLVTNFIKNV